MDKNSRHKDDHKSDSVQEASSSGTKRLDSITASDLGNCKQANQPDGVKPNEVMHPSQQNPVAHASSTNDGVSNSGTIDKSDPNKTHNFNSKPKNQGMINFLDGTTYQQKLIIPIVCRVAKLIRPELVFEIKIEDETAGKFDDIVFTSDDGDISIQAKHKDDKSYTITWDDLISTDKGAPFAISKYFNSFLQNEWDKMERDKPLALEKELDKKETEKPLALVFCKNRFNLFV